MKALFMKHSLTVYIPVIDAPQEELGWLIEKYIDKH